MKEIKFKTWITIVSLSLSIIIGLVSEILKIKPDNPFNIEGFFIKSGILFISLSMIELLYLTKISLKEKLKQIDLWNLKYDGDKELFNIRENFHKVIEGAKDEDDIFVVHFNKEFLKLKRKISEVVEKNELYVNADYFLNADNLLKVFNGYDDSYWYYTWQINDPNEKFFEEMPWHQFFDKSTKLVEQKKMKEVRAILIFQNLDQIVTHPKIQKLLTFYKTYHDNINCKIIDKDVYIKLLRNNSFTNFNDFGIYGNTLLYLEKYLETEAAGYFVKDKNIIKNYTSLYEKLWEHDTIAQPNPSIETSKLTFNSLFNFDQKYKNEDN